MWKRIHQTFHLKELSEVPAWHQNAKMLLCKWFGRYCGEYSPEIDTARVIPYSTNSSEREWKGMWARRWTKIKTFKLYALKPSLFENTANFYVNAQAQQIKVRWSKDTETCKCFGDGHLQCILPAHFPPEPGKVKPKKSSKWDAETTSRQVWATHCHAGTQMG